MCVAVYHLANWKIRNNICIDGQLNFLLCHHEDKKDKEHGYHKSTIMVGMVKPMINQLKCKQAAARCYNNIWDLKCNFILPIQFHHDNYSFGFYIWFVCLCSNCNLIIFHLCLGL